MSYSAFGVHLEDAVLGGLLLEGQIPQEVDAQLSSDLFAAYRRPLANAILSAARETGCCDPVIIGKKLEENGINAAAEIARLIEAVPSQAHLIPHVRLLIERGPADDDPTSLQSSHPYRIQDGRICREKNTRDGVITEPLCNFTATVTEEIVLDDGAETSRAFLIQGHLETGQVLPPVRVPANRFGAMNWTNDAWGVQAVIRAGFSTRDQLREAIQRLSPRAKRRQVFTHTGWREIGSEWVYLTTNGAVGRDGFEVDLGSEELGRYRLPRTVEDPVEAMRESLRLLEIAPITVTAPLWAGTYRAPLSAAFPLDLSLWLEGTTGSLKSTIAALFLSHYGVFDRLHLPGTWKSTANMLERRAFTLKDTLFVVDDYAPSALDVRELEAVAARLLRSQGNLAARGGLREDLTERPSYPPRGLVLSTGEQHPPGQSLLARMVLVEVERGAVDVPTLTKAQDAAHRLPHAMAGYIAWLAPQMPTLPPLLRETFEGARTRATAEGEHLRIPEALAHLWIGLHCGLSYAEEIRACSALEAEDYRSSCWDALITVGRAQGRLVEEERPTRRFLQVLLALVAQGKARLLPTDQPVIGDRGDSPLIGWQDEEAIYLMPEASFKEVTRFCRESGEPFPVRESRLRRDLAQERLSACDPGRYTAVVKIGGYAKRVIKLKRSAAEAVLGEDFRAPLPVVTSVTGLGR